MSIKRRRGWQLEEQVGWREVCCFYAGHWPTGKCRWKEAVEAGVKREGKGILKEPTPVGKELG